MIFIIGLPILVTVLHQTEKRYKQKAVRTQVIFKPINYFVSNNVMKVLYILNTLKKLTL
jgi:hypothetical protein